MASSKRTINLPGLILIYLILIGAAVICILPMLNILAISFSDRIATDSGKIGLVPVGFTANAYKLLFTDEKFLRSFGVSFLRIGLGIPLNIILCVLMAYPLSISNKKFKARTAYVWFFAFTLFFSGGLIPTYMLISELGLLNKIWALVLPGAVQTFFAILLLNFFRNLPNEMSESAFIDGANHFQVLFKIYLPVSKPAISTVLLFALVYHWNSWFDGIIYMNTPDMYPLQSYLQVLLTGVSVLLNSTTISLKNADIIKTISDRTVRSAEVFVGMIPIMIIYPFMQRFFIKGLVIGSVKG